MSAIYPITAVFLDGTTPTDGTAPRLPYAQTIAIPAGTDASILVSCIGQNAAAYVTSGTILLAVAGAVLASGTLTSASSVTLGITASQTAVTAKVYGYSLAFLSTGNIVSSVVPESIYAILPNEYA